MKTLILNGSPRKKGDTVTLIREMEKELQGEVRVVASYFDEIKPCIDCRYCWRHEGCALKDGMQEVYTCLETFDNVIIASPIYFSELTGSLLAMLSRLQTYYSQWYIRKLPPELKKKNGVLLLTGGGDGHFAKARETAGTLFKMMAVDCVAEVMSLHTDRVPAAEDGEALERVREAARVLRRLHEEKR